MKYKNKRRLIIGISLFLLLVFYLFKNLSTSLVIFSFIFGLFIFYVVDHMFKIDFKLRHYIYIILILSGGILLFSLYSIYPLYDKIIHFINPILVCLLIFYILDKKELTIQWKLLISFTFVLSIITIHEIGEYLIDQLWNLKLQGVYIGDISKLGGLNPVMSKIDDTMMDIILGVIGSGLFVIGKTISYFYKRK